jgi:cell division protein FtsA
MPQHVSGLVDVVRNPIHATGVGLLLYGREDQARRATEAPMSGGLREVLDRMKAWFQGNF